MTASRSRAGFVQDAEHEVAIEEIRLAPILTCRVLAHSKRDMVHAPPTWPSVRRSMRAEPCPKKSLPGAAEISAQAVAIPTQSLRVPRRPNGPAPNQPQALEAL